MNEIVITGSTGVIGRRAIHDCSPPATASGA